MGSLPPSWRNQPSFDDEEEPYPPTSQGGNYPPAPNYPPTGQAGQNYPPISLDDPRGAAYPPQGAGGYPPPQQGAGSYPPAGANYPPQGAGGYPPSTGRISLDEPQQYGQAPAYPPQGTGGYPPVQSQPSYPPPQTGSIDLGDPRYGGGARSTTPPRQEFPSDAALTLDDPRFGGKLPNREDASFEGRPSRREKPKRGDDAPQLNERQARTGFGLTERQVEYLAWGSTVILLGISLMMSVAGSARFLTLIFPLVAGGILTASSVYQRVVRGWHVGPLTWLTAILLISYTITLQLAGEGTNIFKWIAYFLGTLTIMTGLILFLQVFRKH